MTDHEYEFRFCVFDLLHDPPDEEPMTARRLVESWTETGLETDGWDAKRRLAFGRRVLAAMVKEGEIRVSGQVEAPRGMKANAYEWVWSSETRQ